jgi:hypothetical protein
MLSRFTVGMKRQASIWRLNEISINIKVPVGDPKLLEKFGSGMGTRMFGGKVAMGPAGKQEKSRELSPRESITMVAFAESSFARSHPETGFTCKLSDLAKVNPFYLDPRVFNGEPYQGYKFTLSGCQDKPSGSFHLTAEPVASTAGTKAYCTDATNNVRSSDDGRGSTCLASGKIDSGEQYSGGDGLTSVGVDVHVHPKP